MMSDYSGEAKSRNGYSSYSSESEKSEPTEPMSRDEIVSATTETSGRDECYSQLAQVNLLRVRKQFAQAVELCESVVTKYPSRADAQGLLGDLYQESGRIDDAILRYCRVLEIDQNNKPNRQKMAAMVRLKRQQLGPIRTEKKKLTIRFDRMVRAIILTFATLMLVTIMVAPLILQQRKQNAIAAASGTTVDRRINLSPIVLQPIAPQPVTGDEPANTTTSTPSIIRDPVEEALVELMSEDTTLLQEGIQVLNAQEDPLTNGFSITFLDRPTSTDQDSRNGIMRSCMKVALSANMRLGSRETKQLNIRCILLSSPTSSTDTSANVPIEATTNLVFTGDILRSSLPGTAADIDMMTTDQLQPYFTNVWWGTGEE